MNGRCYGSCNSCAGDYNVATVSSKYEAAGTNYEEPEDYSIK